MAGDDTPTVVALRRRTARLAGYPESFEGAVIHQRALDDVEALRACHPVDPKHQIVGGLTRILRLWFPCRGDEGRGLDTKARRRSILESPGHAKADGLF